MQYLALLYDAESTASEPGSPEWEADIERYERFGERAGDTIVGGEALAPSATAVTVRSGPSGHVVTDGPYTEATEVVGGFFVFEVEDLDTALEIARHIPAAEDGAVELRPLVQWFQRDTAPSEETTRYLALSCGPESDASEPGSPAWDAAVAEHERFGEEAGSAIVGGGALHPTSVATTVRVRDGDVVVSDGPFPEAAEVVGGMYLLQATSRDEAVGLAKRMPMGPDGCVEVRPIVEMGD